MEFGTVRVQTRLCAFAFLCVFARSYALVRFCTRVQLLHTPALFHTIDVHGNRLTTHIISSSQNHCHSHEKNEEYGMAGGFCRVRMRVARGLRVGCAWAQPLPRALLSSTTSRSFRDQSIKRYMQKTG